MRLKNYKETLDIPEGVTAKLENNVLIVKGKKAELKRRFFHPMINIKVEGKEIVFEIDTFTKREKMQLGTMMAHMKNMLKGANEGYVYKLKICSGHFPMNVSIKGDEFIIKNYVGEKVPRVMKIKSGVKVKLEGEIVTVESSDIELAGQTAGLIEKISMRPRFDKRVFQQGIFITEKPE